jgi:hypothetical protein
MKMYTVSEPVTFDLLIIAAIIFIVSLIIVTMKGRRF